MSAPDAHTELAQVEKYQFSVSFLDAPFPGLTVDEADRSRFDHCVEIFQDFCTVSGAVREGLRIDGRVGPA